MAEYDTISKHLIQAYPDDFDTEWVGLRVDHHSAHYFSGGSYGRDHARIILCPTPHLAGH